MTCRQEFSPLCDLHHTSMRRMMLDDNSGKALSFHICDRRDCNRIFRDTNGYSDVADGIFDGSRESTKTCPHCASVLFLAEVDHAMKMETWECTQWGCRHTEDSSSPSGR